LTSQSYKTKSGITYGVNVAFYYFSKYFKLKHNTTTEMGKFTKTRNINKQCYVKNIPIMY